jgi:hypothetical protein
MAFTPGLQLFTSDPEIASSTPTAYAITDHNRQALEISYDLIEDSNRMADGTMRKFVTANKKKILITWQTVPAAGGRNFTADGNLGAAWLKSFYEENVFKPVWVKMTYAQENWAYGTPYNNSTYNSVSNPTQSSASSTNVTFKRTTDVLAASAAYPFSISSASLSSFSGGVASATLTTSVPHSLTVSGTPYIYVTGVDQIYNGTYQISAVTTNTITYVFGQNNNPDADFNINSFVQSGSTVYIGVDNNDFVVIGASINLFNTKGSIGSLNNINGTWLITGTTGTSVITATNNTFSGSTNGSYGTAQILSSSAGVYKNINSIFPGYITPAIAADVVKTFITNFSYNITHRYALTDYVDMSIEFTEI